MRGRHMALEFSYHSKDVMGAQEFSYHSKGVMGRRSSHIIPRAPRGRRSSHHLEGSMGRRRAHIIPRAPWGAVVLISCEGVIGSGFFNILFVSGFMYPENQGTQVIVSYMHMRYDIISDTTRNRTHNCSVTSAGRSH